MSNRGALVANPLSSRPKCLAECANYIPLFWIAFLSSDEIDGADHFGQFEIDRKNAIERSSNALSFLPSLFPKIRSFETAAGELIEKVRLLKAKTIGIELTELVDEEPDPALPSLKTAVKIIENRNADFSLRVPARTVVNPFTKEKVVARELHFPTTQDVLLEVCMIDREFVTSKSKDYLRETIIGHVWE